MMSVRDKAVVLRVEQAYDRPLPPLCLVFVVDASPSPEELVETSMITRRRVPGSPHSGYFFFIRAFRSHTVKDLSELPVTSSLPSFEMSSTRTSLSFASKEA